MDKLQSWQTDSISADATEAIAEQLGKNLKGGELIVLISDIGGGKTTFVRGLARGLGSESKVTSPTFTLSREYRHGPLRLYHFDFYRLDEPGIIVNELAEVVDDPHHIVVIEWAEIVEHILPTERLTINLLPTGENSRHFAMKYPQSLRYLMKGLQHADTHNSYR